MFLIDSSVWIEYLRPKGSAKIKEKVRELLGLGVVISCAIVVIEILRGAKNKKDFDELHDSFFSLPRIPIDEKVIEMASQGVMRWTEKARLFQLQI